ncbi:hypothetical protein [Streptomyces sp. CBMA156]|uniref:hypothetical protein n=1 Tax=Streptomyces sp. CBMA156 TaxID=1930280 RepID=UPI0016621A36|nr:hypothetical protein [Streptomyces sp. CBMA156]MBD0672195.1 hypothetical protein [Streptomyces sp. CBMA156]
MRKIATTVAAALLSLGALGAGAGVAEAGQYGGYNTRDGGVALRDCAWTSCAMHGRGYGDQHAYLFCYVVGQNVNGDAGWADHNHYLADWSYYGRYYSADYYMTWSGGIYKC